jgi:chemotaxis protein histidine kinase CheA
VLVSRAVMPDPGVLPDSLHDFVYRNAVRVDSGQDFDVHVGRLIRAIELLRSDQERTADQAVQGAIAAIEAAPPTKPTPEAEPPVEPVVSQVGRSVVWPDGRRTVRWVLGLVVILGIIGASGWWVLVEQPAEMARREAAAVEKERAEVRAIQAAAEAKAQQEEQARQAAAAAKAQQEEQARQAAAAAKAQQEERDRQAAAAAKAQQEEQASQAAATAKAQQEEQARQAAAEAKAQQEERDRQAAAAAKAQQEEQASQAAAAAKAQQEEQARQAAAAAKAQQEERDRQAAAVAKAQQEEQARQAAEELKLASRTTPSPQPELLAVALESPPKLDIRGTVSAVASASRIRVAERWLDLYGISDPTQRAHTREVLGYLQPSGGAVECYQKIGGRYQCYADGKDLALLALRDGLARAAADAPEEYRSVPPQQKSARH